MDRQGAFECYGFYSTSKKCGDNAMAEKIALEILIDGWSMGGFKNAEEFADSVLASPDAEILQGDNDGFGAVETGRARKFLIQKFKFFEEERDETDERTEI